tara:strand:+ start:1279 stop:1578 length:300 start_codon:yes stop_codon:yes gene_type:complete
MSSIQIILEDPQKESINYTRYDLKNVEWEIREINVRYRRYSEKKTFIVNYTKYNNEEFIKPYINVMTFEFEYLFDIKNNSFHNIKNYAISLTNITSGRG